MKVCDEIKRRIDEADQPDQLSLEVSRHTARCADCRAFGDERASLRNLLASGARVSVPVNFDAVLKARLDEAAARRSFSWLNPALYMRLGAATAVLAVMFFAAQRGGLFSNEYQALSAAGVTQSPGGFKNPDWISPATTARRAARLPGINQQAINQPGETALAAYRQGPRNVAREKVRAAPAPVASASFDGLYDGGVILVRGQNGDREVAVPTVSIGAQPLLYASRPSQPVRSVSTSF
jgi:hypothetical protein